MQPVEEQLQREAAARRVAVASAAIGAVLPLVGSIIAASAGNPPKARKHHTDAPLLLFTHHHATTLLAGAIVLGLGAIPIALALRYLFDATKFRHPAQPRIALYAALVGAGAILVTRLAFQIVVNKKSADFAINPANFAAGSRHAEAVAKHLLASGGVSITGAAGYAGGLALGFAFVMISLNAMRAGLLTRFMGIIGIFSGILFVLPVIPLPVVQSFWLGALAFLFAGRWPSGLPPAWESGQAEPWPSQQELREARERGETAAPGGRKRLPGARSRAGRGGGRRGGDVHPASGLQEAQAQETSLRSALEAPAQDPRIPRTVAPRWCGKLLSRMPTIDRRALGAIFAGGSLGSRRRSATPPKGSRALTPGRVWPNFAPKARRCPRGSRARRG